MISTFLNVLPRVTQSNLFAIIKNIPHTLEKNVYPVVGQSTLYMSQVYLVSGVI